MIIRITPEQAEELRRPVNMPVSQQGGFQRLIVRLQEGLRYQGPDAYTLILDNEDAERVVHFAWSYGEGTYQRQLRAIAGQISAILEDAKAKQPALFGEQP